MTEFYTMLDDERATAKFEFWKGFVALHLTIKKRFAGMRAAKEIFAPGMEILRALGYRVVYVLIPDGDEKLYRFERSFGFNEIKRANGHILMKREV